MARSAKQYALLGQLSLFGGLLICFLLMPKFLLEHNEGGVSNYGLYAKTVIPYTLAYVLCSGLTIRAAQALPRTLPARQPLRRALIWLAILFMLVLLTTYPYKLSHLLDLIHIYTGIALFVAELIMGAWFGVVLARNRWNTLLLTGQLVGSVLLVLTLAHAIHVLFVAQLVASAAFALLLVRTLAVLTPNQ